MIYEGSACETKATRFSPSLGPPTLPVDPWAQICARGKTWGDGEKTIPSERKQYCCIVLPQPLKHNQPKWSAKNIGPGLVSHELSNWIYISSQPRLSNLAYIYARNFWQPCIQECHRYFQEGYTLIHVPWSVFMLVMSP